MNKIKDFIFKKYVCLIVKYPILFKYINQKLFITMVTDKFVKLNENRILADFRIIKKWLSYSKIEDKYYIQLVQLLLAKYVISSLDTLKKSNLIHDYIFPYLDEIIMEEKTDAYIFLYLLWGVDKLTDKEFKTILNIILSNDYYFLISHEHMNKIMTEKQRNEFIFIQELIGDINGNN